MVVKSEAASVTKGAKDSQSKERSLEKAAAKDSNTRWMTAIVCEVTAPGHVTG